MKTIFLTLSLLLPSAPAFAKGHLFILGGGARPDTLMERFIGLSGGTSSHIAIIPMASQDPADSAEFQKAQFERLGAKSVVSLIFRREEADSPENIAKIRKASGVYFTGGDQNRLTAALLGTELLQEIRTLYEKSGAIGGTSAGAAVMSRVMITGDERINPGADAAKAFQSIRSSNVITAAGFGFTDKALIDQHFLKKQRHSRLISLALEIPDLPGIGIDESTALIIYPDDTCEVLGDSSVVIYDAKNAKNVTVDRTGLFSAEGITVDILTEGGRYDLKTRSVIKRTQ